jgi:hypothetical protein
LAAGATALSAVTAYVKTYDRYSAGDDDAGFNYRSAAGVFTISAAASTLAAFITYKVTTAAIMGTVPVLGSLAVTAGMALSLTGIGIVLALAGLFFTLRAIYFEDDTREIFLDRCYFGKHSRSKTNPPFSDLDAEKKALNALVQDMRVSLEWQDLLGPDQIRASVFIAHWQPDQIIEYRLLIKAKAQQTSRDLYPDIVLAQGAVHGLPKPVSAESVLVTSTDPAAIPLTITPSTRIHAPLAPTHVLVPPPQQIQTQATRQDPQRTQQTGQVSATAQGKADSNSYELSIVGHVGQESLYTRAEFEFKYWEHADDYKAKQLPKAFDTIRLDD